MSDRVPVYSTEIDPSPVPARLVAAGQDVTIRVPATSANLGPGFDTLGLAVSLFDTVRVRTNTSGIVSVRVTGEGADSLPTDGNHLVARTLLETLDRAGYGCPGLELETENLIPHGRGLGSSAAAIVTAVLGANFLLPDAARMAPPALLQLCSTLEGHPDNVAPALVGALAISWETGRVFHSTRVPVHPSIIPIAAVPSTSLSTESARALLPTSVSHASAAANAGRAALLIDALSREPEFILDATQDELHQDYRAQAMLPSATLMRQLRAQGFPAVISGAGPTVMTLAVGEAQATAAEQAIRSLTADPDNADSGAQWRVLRLTVAPEGAKLVVHQRNES
ncbi:MULTISPECIES: homoserine kinase [unclassified Arthrobacter]|uniref:homoserine kinase n=1 Tax=unclassified Arthrobacter TaxID=235627 RepID=UPI00298F081E|nr:homoserine kinase [Arthrobacter sp. AET 35A]